MKTIIAIIAFITISFHALCQPIVDANNLIGKWKVKHATLNRELISDDIADLVDELEQLSQGFKGLIFSFFKNKNIEVDIPQDFPDKLKEMFIFIDNRKWKIDEKGIIQIGDSDVGYNLMGILLIHKDDRTYFILDETPLQLEMEKIEEF